MRVPMKVDYGVRALVEMARHAGEKPLPTAEIASRQAIPEPYLDQLLSTLSKAGIIRSRRGPQGGHTLARSPAEINLGAVVSTLEGMGAPLVCIEEPSECSIFSTCAQREIWQTLDETIQNVLSSTTIGDLAMSENRKVRQGMYYI